jgi:hypothetical protein
MANPSFPDGVTPPSFVVDTNVLIDVFSWHAPLDEYDKLHATLGGSALDDPRFVHKIARAKESLLLLLHLNRTCTSTVSLRNEALGILERRAPPDGQDAAYYTRTVIWFVQERLLPDWDAGVCGPGQDWEKLLVGPGWPAVLRQEGHKELKTPTGDRADAWHVAMAKEQRIPLISNEGFGETGYGVSRIKKLAQGEGVSVCFPKDVYENAGMDVKAVSDDFLERFKWKSPGYVRDRALKYGPDDTGKVMNRVYGYYQMVLKGLVEGRASPIKTSIG